MNKVSDNVPKPLSSREPLKFAISQAPGKAVLTGDYAVLLDAPALVLAVDRYATAQLRESEGSGWRIASNVEKTTSYASLNELLAEAGNTLLSRILRSLPNPSRLPEHAELVLDTHTFFQNDLKLGLGSSASILVAIAELCDHLTHHRFDDATLIDIHNSFQSTAGSGVDVLASRKGGLTRFQQGAAQRVPVPPGLSFRFVFTGRSSRTSAMLAKFHTVLQTLSEQRITDWKALASAAANAAATAAGFLECLTELNEFVLNFDDDTGLGIYSAPHRNALEAAKQAGVLYKPCGAGGGDIGVAVTDDPAKLKTFERDVTQRGLALLNLSISNHGATVQF